MSVTPSLPRFTLVAAATVVAACAAGAWPTLRMAGEGGLVAMAVAAGVALATSVLGYVPLAVTTRSPLDRRAQAFLAGMGLRLFATLGVLLAVWVLDAPHKGVIVVWTGVLYLLLLLVEILVVARGLLRAGRNGGPASA
jgi:hypothetical protein